MLVETLLAETPAGAGSEVAVLVNGLGGTKYEEMFVFYNDVAALLGAAGLQPYNPLIGEFVTSLDMTGMSLSLFWLDDELKALLDATAVFAAFTSIGPTWRRPPPSSSAAASATAAATDADAVTAADEDDIPGGECGSAGAGRAAAGVGDNRRRWRASWAGSTPRPGTATTARAWCAACAPPSKPSTASTGTARRSFTRGGIAFQNAAGGASGALVGAWLIAIGAGLPERDEAVDAAALALALDQALATLQRLGQAQPGDKTMIDTLAPFCAALNEAAARGAAIPIAWAAALPAAQTGMLSTVDMVSRRGRASRLGERSRGVQDAGATSIYYVLRAFGEGFSG